MRGIPEVPDGLQYVPSFLSGDDQGRLMAELRTLQYGEVRMHDQVARRVVRHWGVGYDFDTRQLRPGEQIPAWLDPLRRRAAALMDVALDELAEALATYYPPGATIGWHRDAPAFGTVAGVSFGSACLMRFQLGKGAERRVHEQLLEPGSAYVLAGPARTRWEHSIPAVKDPRWSVTFRTIRRGWVR
ncbi:MAG: alpha-ketoglutarate-dependent dioxygenase AlkB [Actinobacteria bacterium]|nr:alpha-ketoglutarate-dependent dioxygenase AlkB [Actinomycetota bacterium]